MAAIAPGGLRRNARMSGYKGRTGVYELMVADDQVSALIHNARRRKSQLFVAAEAAGLALDARGRRAPGRRGHHLRRGSDARHARLT